MEQRIRAQVETLKQQRAAFVAQAQVRIAAFDGAIQALEGLLKEGESGAGDSAMGESVGQKEAMDE